MDSDHYNKKPPLAHWNYMNNTFPKKTKYIVPASLEPQKEREKPAKPPQIARAAISFIVAAIIIASAAWLMSGNNNLPIKTGSVTAGTIMLESDLESIAHEEETSIDMSGIFDEASAATEALEQVVQAGGTLESSSSEKPSSSAPESKKPETSSKPAEESSKPAPAPPPTPPSGFASWLGNLKTGADGYVSSITVGGTAMSGQRFRQKLGTNRIRSASFTYRIEGDNFIFTTKGYGHGVGLSQWGAYFYANNDGWGYEKILKHYYKGCSIVSSENVDDNYVYALAQIVDVEVGASFPIEAIKAQAIAAHSFLLYNGQTPTRTNRVVGDKVLNAVKDVKNKIATYNGSAINAQYFASCNGKTRNSKDVWGGHLPYLVSVESKYDHLSTGWQRDCVVAASVVKQQFGL